MPSGSLIALPAFPPAPASFEFIENEIAAAATSIFTGQQQINDWGPGPSEISVSWPAMTKANAAAWITFFGSLKGIVNYFAFGSAFTTAYPEFAGKNWRLKTSSSKWSVDGDRVYRLTFEAREA